MTEKLTNRQTMALEAIRNFHAKRGVMPSYSEIAIMLGVKESGAHGIVVRLEKKGYIKRSRKARMMKII